MKLERILPFARRLLETAVTEGTFAVDATAGNGHDSLFLANLVGENGQVFSFDIQQEAIEKTSSRLIENKVIDRVTLYQESHDNLKAKIPVKFHGSITGAVFNLGYLPGGDKGIVTTPESTIKAVEQLLEIMSPEGVIVIVIYHGHEEGAIERDRLLEFVTTIHQETAHVLTYRFINQVNNPPFIVAIEKR